MSQDTAQLCHPVHGSQLTFLQVSIPCLAPTQQVTLATMGRQPFTTGTILFSVIEFCCGGVQAALSTFVCLLIPLCSQGCFIGCDACDHKSGRQQVDLCNSGQKPTINDPLQRSVNRDAEAGSDEDIYKHNPWRYPGNAPIADVCGLAGGTPWGPDAPEAGDCKLDICSIFFPLVSFDVLFMIFDASWLTERKTEPLVSRHQHDLCAPWNSRF